MKKWSMLAGLVMVTVALLLTGCNSNASDGGSSAEGTDEGGDQIEIAGILMQSDVEWFKYIQMGMEKAAEENNVNLTIGNANEDITEESNLLDTYSSQGKDAVLLSAIDSSASAEAIKRAQEKDVLVVNYNTGVDLNVQEYFVGIDNFELGAQAGRSLVEYVEENMGGEAKVAMITLSMYEIGKQRAEGFLSEVEQAPGIEIVAQQDAAGPEDGANVTETIIRGNPDIDLIWGANEGGAVGAIVGVQSSGLEDKVKVFGTDMSLQTAQYLLDDSNPYYAVSTQQPYEIGYQAVITAVKALQGEEVEAETIVPLDMYSKEDKEKVQAYLDEYSGL
ncbi:substrate-binding domain-containing protein [Alkalihalobacillus oceani]|uniref:Substrate-binding domain-containing protein n=1 Tax=Halalkalibacter oceani TaxID=1653776 RepID=A0A9X2DSS5_9BACI|nr:substrate-binding domain-containing protein [Halalkalibacter oceani]MCM3715515.1 substrate-binding domain-containing protein [Halalkalibacter oceani]